MAFSLIRSTVEKKTHSLFYRPYSYFRHSEGTSELPGQSEVKSIEDLIRSEEYSQARFRAKELIAETLEGLRYLQT